MYTTKPTLPTFNDFLVAYYNGLDKEKQVNKYIRDGQYLMNLLCDVWNEVYQDITFKQVNDCFYNDKKITSTLEYLQSLWK